MSPAQTQELSELVKTEIAKFADKASIYQAGQVPDEEFRPFRLLHGVYGQRQAQVQMVRIKIPGGQVSPEQLRALGDSSRDFAPLGIGHLTTRQCVQMHFVRLQDTPTLMTRLAEVGITTREACGNSVRNITASPVSGLAADEVFDVYPYADAAFRYFLRRPEFQNLPRKWKMSFNSTRADHSQACINDVGFYAAMKDGQRGFKIKVGGGLGASPQDAWTLHEFLPENEVLAWVEAVLLHFNEKGERKNRMAARVKFLIRKEGWDVFQAEVKRIHEGLEKKVIPFPLEPQSAEPQTNPLAQAPSSGPGAFADWLRLNCWPQKQKGFHYALIRLTLGDLSWQQFHGIANLTEKYGSKQARFSNDQNLMLPYIPSDRLAELYTDLQALKLDQLGPDLIGDVTSCPGADTCNLGLTSSRGLGAALTELFTWKPGVNDDLKGTHIKISGCPNSCGQHHIGTLGFFGNVRKVDGKDSPHFQVMIGGGINEDGAKFGKTCGRVPARRIGKVAQAFIDKYRAERQADETFESYLRRLEPADAKKVVEPFAEIASLDPELFKDNGSEENFVFEGLGASECA